MRTELKGTTTEQKLRVVRAYLGYDRPDSKVDCCKYETRAVQVLNYLTALSRGGLIEIIDPIYQNTNTVGTFLQLGLYKIRR